jgi:hypothetical protein
MTNHPFTLWLNDVCYLHTRESIQVLSALVKNCDHTLGQLGFVIKTGEVVWNTAKERLTEDSSQPLLIHNAYLKDNQLQVPTEQGHRPLYINDSEYPNQRITEPVILVNRGNGNNGNLRVAFVYFDPQEYPGSAIAENHIYKIYDNGQNQLRQLYQSLCDPLTTQFIQTCIGSGFLTKKFIQLLPVWNI